MADAQMFLLANTKSRTQQLVICFKSMHINTYNVMLLNLATKMIIFRHESQHLWEASVRSVLLKSEDLIILSHEGIRILNLGLRPKKVVKSQNNTEYMLHPLNSCSDLRLESTNHLKFTHGRNGMVVSVQEQYQDSSLETFFDDIYKICIHELALRELLLIQSIFLCRQQYDIVKLIDLQPDISVFLKASLELGKRNMLQILSFDSKSIASLLDERHAEMFRSEYPVIYKTEREADDLQIRHADLFRKELGKSAKRLTLADLRVLAELDLGRHQHRACKKESAIDKALESNQVVAV